MTRIVGIGNPLWDVFAPAGSNMEVVERFGRGSVNHLEAREMEEILSRVSGARWVAGGGARNTLALLAALGHETYLTGAMGDDEQGTAYRLALSAAGIGDCLQSAGRQSTGTCVTLMHETGETTVIVSPGAALELEDVSATAPRDPDVVVLEGFVAPRAGLAASSVEYVVDAGASLVVDLGHPGVAAAAAALAEATVQDMPDGGARPLVFGTEAEVAATASPAGAGEASSPGGAGGATGAGDPSNRESAGDAGEAPSRGAGDTAAKVAAQLEAGIARLSASADVLIVKSGERGAAVYRGGAETASASPSVAAKAAGGAGGAAAPGNAVVDTTGAGDVFAGAFLAAWLRGMPDNRACALANLAAGISLSSYGGRLTSDQLRVLMGELAGEL